MGGTVAPEGGKTLFNVSAFIVVLLVGFAWIGRVVTGVSGGEVRKVEGVGPEAGEAIFLGRGNCYTCHAVGDKGSAVRGPNQGESGPLGMAIGQRAAARAEERTAATGTAFTATDYLLESLIEPDAYVVEGYKAEMPAAHLPPIALGPDEIRATVAYLASLGGDAEGLQVERSPFWPAVMAAAAGAGEAEPFQVYLEGDPEAGRELFFGQDVACTRCHVVGGEGGYQGPELTALAATRTPAFIIESIVDPGATVASGFEQTRVVLLDWNEVVGIKTGETEELVEVTDAAGEVHRIAKSDIDEIRVDPGSVMPANFAELLTVRQFHDLLAYLLTLDGTATAAVAAGSAGEVAVAGMPAESPAPLKEEAK